MANRKLNPEEKRIICTYAVKSKFKDQVAEVSKYLDISASQFVEEAIVEKLEKIKRKTKGNKMKILYKNKWIEVARTDERLKELHNDTKY